jgi:GH18 family chitinase
MGKGYVGEKETASEYDGLSTLVRATRKRLSAGMVISVAYYPDQKQERLLHATGVDTVADYLHIMAYDQPVSASALTPASINSEPGAKTHSSMTLAEQSIRQAADSGLPMHKVTLGLPFYGRHSRTGDWTTYEDIVQKYHPLSPTADIAIVVLNTNGDNDSLNENGDSTGRPDGYIGFNGIDTISAKTRLALAQGLGGLMIWEVGQDCRVTPTVRVGHTHGVTCPQGSNSSLLEAISRTLVAANSGISSTSATVSSGDNDLNPVHVALSSPEL